jgi:hypothetical protein
MQIKGKFNLNYKIIKKNEEVLLSIIIMSTK